MSAVAILLAKKLMKKEITKEQIPEKYRDEVQTILIEEGLADSAEG